ncbi:uncharacterized protein YybS (DUF2232 family) [Evansella vedderi]|uniref:Uncharacterized protein YybS (DUF2232 family) n=1 Tax=Evansella vedderi TaxID=38282 RepID=A0ABU0A258_9BACI|nr:YybS family protein [Evansella vedderi]MDQ0257583.1 uncharacterized protein YybS (DUF2232 family) [Evansella vedderi]
MERSDLIKEGSKFLAVYLLLVFLTLFVPLVSLFTIFLLPIPFIVFTYKHGLKPGILLGLISFFLIFIITPLSLPITVSFAAGGIVMGELYRRNKNAFGVLLGGSLAFIAALILNYIGTIVLLNTNPIEVIQDLFRESLELSEQMLGTIGQQDQQTLEVASTFIDQLVYTAPSIFIILGIGYAFIIQLLASFIMRKLKYNINRFPPFREWSFPRAFIWYYLITYIILIIGVEEGTALFIVVSNLTPILEVVMVIQGLAFIFFFFHLKKRSKVIPIVITIISFLFPFMLHLIRILGIIDLGFELRKRLKSNSEK